MPNSNTQHSQVLSIPVVVSTPLPTNLAAALSSLGIKPLVLLDKYNLVPDFPANFSLALTLKDTLEEAKEEAWRLRHFFLSFVAILTPTEYAYVLRERFEADILKELDRTLLVIITGNLHQFMATSINESITESIKTYTCYKRAS